MSQFDSFDFVPYYRYLLLVSIPSHIVDINGCARKGFMRSFGISLGFESMRLFLYQESSGRIQPYHILGDKEIWKNFDISHWRKDSGSFKNLFLVKIRYLRDNGQSVNLGYLGFQVNYYVSPRLLKALDVFCILYGNMVINTLLKGRQNNVNVYLPKIYAMATSNALPGTKISQILFYIKQLSGYNKGLYCTISGNKVVAEYFSDASNKCCILNRHTIWEFSKYDVENLYKIVGGSSCSLANLPKSIQNFFTFHDTRSAGYFDVCCVPVFVDEELLGLWLFSFSKNNPYDLFDINKLLDNIFPLISDSYKFLFQRRFKKMIVNPIFQNRDTRIDVSSVFVIMPFTESWSNEVWQDIIVPAVKEIGMIPVRADDLYGQNIMEDVWQGILKASIVICDTTGRNPNVFYELGIAHTLGKQVLLLTQNIDDIPFDLLALRHVKYSFTISGARELRQNIKDYIQELVKRN